MKSKIKLFICAPTEFAPDKDSLHVIGEYSGKYDALDSYMYDDYKEIARVGSLKAAKKICLKYGIKRPKVI